MLFPGNASDQIQNTFCCAACEPRALLHLFIIAIKTNGFASVDSPVNKVAYLEGALGVSRRRLKRMIVASPALLSYSIEDNLRPKVQFGAEPSVRSRNGADHLMFDRGFSGAERTHKFTSQQCHETFET